MKKLLISIIFSFFLTLGVSAKTLDQKKDELKKIYEAGGISKVEYKKAIEFLEKPKDKDKEKIDKKSLSLVKKKRNKTHLKKKIKKKRKSL